jgi:tRNA-uridine 2-sulfurtransferase
MARVCMALSGGVDSAVSAARLLREGHDVFAVFIQVWQPDFLDCTQEEDRKSAKRVAAALGIQFYVLDCSHEYRQSVIDVMTAAYERGHTPNPDILCNVHIKFGALWRYASGLGATHIATGHYAQTVETDSGVQLKKAVDSAKDQVYFISMIPKDIVARCIFPVGAQTKAETRAEALKYSVPVAEKKDSQGLCFMGMITLDTFLGSMTALIPGEVLNTSGMVVGRHTGAQQFTLGQRHGFTLYTPSPSPSYVTKIDVSAHAIIVDDKPPVGATCIRLVNYMERVPHLVDKHYTAQVRYHGECIPCTVSVTSNTALVTFAQPVLVADDQVCVIYDEDVLVGSGLVTTTVGNV